MKNLFLIAAMLMLVSCGDDAAPQEQKISKVSEIYFRFAMEYAVGDSQKYKSLMTLHAIADGARCVQDKIVGKKLGIYGRAPLQSLLVKHLFPGELSSYQSFVSTKPVKASMEKRTADLGFKTVADAAKSTSMIAKALVREYAFYARFNDIHKMGAGMKAENLVVTECTPASIQPHLKFR